jgi:glycine oxidase
MRRLEISVLGAGIVGLWQAYTLAFRGHAVHLIERAPGLSARAASQCAGAMLAPFCERETALPIVQALGLRALGIWQSTLPCVVSNGTLVVAHPRDQSELIRFAQRTEQHRRVDCEELGALEPDLDRRFSGGLFFHQEAHIEPGKAFEFLLRSVRRLGARITFGRDHAGKEADYVIDCRGMGAKRDLTTLRGVRGERIIVQTSQVALRRPVRLLHPRFPLYVVPWEMGTYAIGATMIESEDNGPVTLRSALDLLATACSLHSAFAEARLISLDAGVRPAFPDNAPKVVVAGRHILVNGLYRHGFLLAPALAELVADYLAGEGPIGPFIIRPRTGELDTTLRRRNAE